MKSWGRRSIHSNTIQQSCKALRQGYSWTTQASLLCPTLWRRQSSWAELTSICQSSRLPQASWEVLMSPQTPGKEIPATQVGISPLSADPSTEAPSHTSPRQGRWLSGTQKHCMLCPAWDNPAKEHSAPTHPSYMHQRSMVSLEKKNKYLRGASASM